jgi:toxin ParE1/3/4
MPVLELAPEARQDVKEIGRYIVQTHGRPNTAAQVTRAIKSKCVYYAQFPSAGQAAPELGENLRLGIHQRWVIIYEPSDNGIRVLRIVDGARDYPKLFESGGQ